MPGFFFFVFFMYGLLIKDSEGKKKKEWKEKRGLVRWLRGPKFTFPTPTRQLIATYNSSSREFNSLLWSLWSTPTHMTYTHMHIRLKKKKKSLKAVSKCVSGSDLYFIHFIIIIGCAHDMCVGKCATVSMWGSESHLWSLFSLFTLHGFWNWDVQQML